MVKKKYLSDVKRGVGTKDDSSKIDVTYVDPQFIIEVAKAMQRGAKKYARGNWQLKVDPKRNLAAMIRHVIAIWQGEIYDKESGLRHDVHVACNAMFLNYYGRKGVEVKTEHKYE